MDTSYMMLLLASVDQIHLLGFSWSVLSKTFVQLETEPNVGGKQTSYYRFCFIIDIPSFMSEIG